MYLKILFSFFAKRIPFSCYGLLILLAISVDVFSQKSLLENSTYSLMSEPKDIFQVKDTLIFKKATNRIFLPKFSTFRLKFRFEKTQKQDTIAYIRCENQGAIKLFEVKGATTKLVSESGLTCPFYKRSIRDETAFIKVNLGANQAPEYLLELKNFNIEHSNLSILQYNYAQYQEVKLKRKDLFINKYGQPIFLGVVVLILLITLFQLAVFKEKIYLIYLCYIIFILLRVAMNISLLVIEDFIPALRDYGFISRFSQSFSCLSIITYLFFIREFAHTKQKTPKFDLFIICQIAFMGVYCIAELFMVVEKYTVPILIATHSWFELIETILGVITMFGLIKLYDKQNKYLIWGVIFLFLVAFVGQQLLLRLSSISRMEQDVYLQILWGIAYLGEMIFFTLALFDRAAIMKQTIELQNDENKKLINELAISREKDGAVQPETLNIATNKGTIIIQQEDICRVEASGNYTVFYVNNKKQVMASNTMAEFEDKLDSDKFLRVHKSHIVNLRFVVKYTKGDGGSLTLQDGSEIPVSRSRKDDLLKKLFSE